MDNRESIPVPVPVHVPGTVELHAIQKRPCLSDKDGLGSEPILFSYSVRILNSWGIDRKISHLHLRY